MKKLTLSEQVQELLKNEGLKEVYQQARVSLDNNHYCTDCFCCACVDYLNSEEVKTKFFDMQDVKFANSNVSNYFFAKDTMRFFNSRICGELIKNRLFVTSEKQGYDYPRLYTIRYVTKEGKVDTLGKFQEYTSSRQAKETARQLVKGLK